MNIRVAGLHPPHGVTVLDDPDVVVAAIDQVVGAREAGDNPSG